MQKTWVQFLGWEDLLEKRMASHSRIFAWIIQRTENSGGLWSMGLQRVGHDWSDLAHMYTPLVLPSRIPAFFNEKKKLPVSHKSEVDKRHVEKTRTHPSACSQAKVCPMQINQTLANTQPKSPEKNAYCKSLKFHSCLLCSNITDYTMSFEGPFQCLHLKKESGY